MGLRNFGFFADRRLIRTSPVHDPAGMLTLSLAGHGAQTIQVIVMLAGDIVLRR